MTPPDAQDLTDKIRECSDVNELRALWSQAHDLASKMSTQGPEMNMYAIHLRNEARMRVLELTGKWPNEQSKAKRT